MAIFQYEMCFGQNLTDNGWREIITWNGTGTGPFDGSTGRQNWIDVRLPFLAQDCFVFAVTTRQIDGVAKSAKTVKMATFQYGQAAGPSNLVGDEIGYNAWSANNANRRTMTFRGIPDAWVEGGQLTSLGVGGLASIDAYMNYLISKQVAIRVADSDFPWTAIEIITPKVLTGPGYDLKIVTAAGTAADVDTGDTVLVKGLIGYPYVNGTWLAGKIDADSFTLAGSKRYYVAEVDMGEWRLFSPKAVAIDSYGYSDCGTRQTGRRPFLPRGRRSAKVLHR